MLHAKHVLEYFFPQVPVVRCLKSVEFMLTSTPMIFFDSLKNPIRRNTTLNQQGDTFPKATQR